MPYKRRNVQREFRIDNFSLGMRRDGATTQDRMFALRTIKNYYIDYTEGKLVVRPGYSRWNDTALANPADQLYWLGDMDGNEHLLGKIGGTTDTWYKIAESGAHTNICAHACTSRRPAFSFGNRVMFGTDKDATEIMAGGNGLQWADDTSIGTGDSYRVGIKRPTTPPNADITAPIGHIISVTGLGLYLDTTTQYSLGFQFTTTIDKEVNSMVLSVFKRSALSLGGNVRIKIYTNNAGSPSTTLADPDAISNWWPVGKMPAYGGALSTSLKLFEFANSFELSAGIYWFVLESDATYRSNYINAGGSTFYCVIGSDAPAPPTYAYAKYYNNVTSSWVATAYEPYFYLGVLDVSKFYDYVLTYYNSDYGIESRKSDNTRIDPTATEPITQITLPTPTDGQVDKIRIYRREMDDIEYDDDDITDTYKFVAEGEAGETILDMESSDSLGAVLQTDDHYCIDEVDEEGTKLRETEIHPKVATVWKGRVWVAPDNSNSLYMSKKLEEDGATGLTGDLIPDYFPLENKLEIGCPSKIQNIAVMPTDELAVYFANSTIWLVSGANDIQNPPSDMNVREVPSDIGLISSVAVDGFRGRHILLSRHGLYAFNGTPILEKLSGYIESILDDITDANIDDSIVTTLGDEVWLLVDDDNDGSLNGIYILDVGQNPVTWRLYDYGVTLNDLIVRQIGTEYKTLYAADAVNKYILKLNTGTADNDEDITAEIETHPFRGKNRMSLYMVEIDAYYPSTVPTYTVTITDHSGNEDAYTLSPTGSEDIRGHHTGVRVTSDPQARVKLSHDTQLANELLSIAVGYVER